MDVRSRVDVSAEILTRVIDPDPRTKKAIDRALDEGHKKSEPATATNMAKQIVADEQATRAAVRAERAEFELRVRVEVEVEIDIEITADGIKAKQKPPPSDPVVVDLDGDGQFETTGVAGGRIFDVDGDASAEQTSFVGGGDAFLVWDRNANGQIDDGHELFGDQHGATDGIAELARHDTNSDGWLDASDAVWSSLGLWRGDSIVGLGEAGFTGASITRQALRSSTTGGDAVQDAITLYRADGSSVRAADVWLARA